MWSYTSTIPYVFMAWCLALLSHTVFGAARGCHSPHVTRY